MKNLHLISFLFWLFLTTACSPAAFIKKTATEDLITQKDLRSAHIGICVYDPAAAKYLYNYQSDKYFVPASNTKLFSLYAGMKYLGDSLNGMDFMETDTATFIIPTGDPTLLHPDYTSQPVIDFLKKTKNKIYITNANWHDQPLGAGWSWDDYNDDYMVERNAFPVYGNVIKWVEEKQQQSDNDKNFAPSPSIYSIPEVNWKVTFDTAKTQKHFYVRRKKDENIFSITEGSETFRSQYVPFVTNGIGSAIELLKDTIGKEVFEGGYLPTTNENKGTIMAYSGPVNYKDIPLQKIHSRPVDSMFIPMMHRSDNFFAEQTLLMVSNERFGAMNDDMIIDTLLKADLKNLPQKPNWADGSGLSRFNLFTPQDFVWLLNTMKDEFGIERMKHILPTGGTGTLRNYYKKDSGYVFAKTGSLTGVLCLSGYVYTKKNKLLIFSILVNNHNGSAAAIRSAFEKFVLALRGRY